MGVRVGQRSDCGRRDCATFQTEGKGGFSRVERNNMKRR